MKTTFIKNYIDEILVGENSPKDYELLKKLGYADDSGEVSLTMMFGDGIAYDTSMNGVVMHYPTLYDVSQSEEMQNLIRLHCGERCDDHIEQWDIALTFGRIGYYLDKIDEFANRLITELKEMYC